MTSRPLSHACPACNGSGCDACQHTGRRYRVTGSREGLEIVIHGSGDPPVADLINALLLFAEAAFTPSIDRDEQQQTLELGDDDPTQ